VECALILIVEVYFATVTAYDLNTHMQHIKHTKRILCDKSLRTPVKREYCLGRLRGNTCTPMNNTSPNVHKYQTHEDINYIV